MTRIAKWSLAAMALGAMAFAGGARAADEDSDLKALLADCGSANIERSDIDSCLERARDISENAPSAQLQTLTARLERRAEALDDAEQDKDKPAQTQVADTPAPAPAGGGGSTVGASVAAAAPH
ncbi:MAG TPA: hypothetical protein VKB71_02535 [Rhizomicrobium sp.]|nr:hypothetical protein [Rhizomicrobium sp.]